MENNEPTAGEHMTKEIAEQPDVLSSIVEHRADIADVASLIDKRQPRFALLAARGSSDYAALYAKYLIEIFLGLPAGLVSPSTVTLYSAQPNFQDVLLISVSQSGASPDLVEFADTARKRGALTVAVSNTPSSPLQTVSELGVDIRAGRENAVAATKTYSATLLTLYLLVDAIRGGKGDNARNIGQQAQETLIGTESSVRRAVDRYRFVDRVVTTGRGYSFPTALEAALKLAETSYLAARAYSGADLLHGPVASIDPETAVLAFTNAGRGGDAMRSVLDVVADRGADLLTIGAELADSPADLHIPLPDIPDELAPVLEVIPVQRLALSLALARGFNPDQPHGLNKVTKTR